MTPAAIEKGIVAYLRALPADAKPHTGDMRREIGCGNADLKSAIERMRMRGKLQFDRLQLSPSMLETAAVLRVVPPPTAPVLLSAPQQLLRDVEAYCRRTGTPEARIGKVLFHHAGYVGLLRKRGTAKPESMAAVRALMAEHPEGVPVLAEQSAPPAKVEAAPATAPTPVAEQVRQEAEDAARRRRAAKSTGSVHSGAELAVARETPQPRKWVVTDVDARLEGLTLIEQIQTLLAEEPGDLIAAVQRVHDGLWQRCLGAARRAGKRPALLLYLAIELGLGVIDEDFDDLFPKETVNG